MKIAVIGPTYPFRGGIAHYTTLLVQHLRERHQVLFISYLKQYPKWLYPGNTAMDPSPDSSVLQVECARVLIPLNPLTWWRAFRMISNDAPNLLILQWWTPFWSPMLFFLTRMIRRFTSVRILFICHHIIAPEGGLLDWFMARRILWRGHAFIVMSEEDFALLRRALPWARIKGTTLPPYDVFSRAPVAQTVARKRLGLNETEPVLLFFGFVRRHKGLRYLLNALPQVRKEIPVRLLVVGEFWEEERIYRELVELYHMQSAVNFYSDYVPNDELSIYFSAADVVVLPYLEATQSGVAQLAFGFEKPMIATSVGGMPETVRDGKTGLIVSPGDADALATAILRFFREGLSDVFAENIREEKKSATWAHMINLIEELSRSASDPKSEQPAQGVSSPRVI